MNQKSNLKQKGQAQSRTMKEQAIKPNGISLSKSNNNDKSKPAKKSWFREGIIIPTIIFGMGIIPLFIGLFLYLNPQLLSGDTTARGELITPPVDISRLMNELNLQDTGNVDDSGKWQIVIIANDRCDQTCEDVIYYSRQVNEALKEEEQLRVARSLFTNDITNFSRQQLDAIAGHRPRLRVSEIDPDRLSQILSSYRESSASSVASLNNNLFIVDPLGNMMMRHNPLNSVDGAKDLLKDIKQLLRASRIG